ncbi:hypothetical protein Golob_011605 [Gossypium lobatum]|uniref:Pectate lyase n=1 Tax=Gossypium lobatum TaxID=34289 RepID=A0A7J8MQ95_9ROSI|nr:hypothetical protein [Gossypium lobatum]
MTSTGRHENWKPLRTWTRPSTPTRKGCCWRCDPDWEKNRKKFADCAPGFARGTTGGKDGSITIKLQQELIVTSDKTIDARGVNVEICNGAGITIQFTKNVIIHGLQIHHIILAKGGKIKDGEKTMGYGVPATEMGSLFSEQPTFGSTIFPFTIASMALSM